MAAPAQDSILPEAAPARRRVTELDAAVRPFIGNIPGTWWRIESPITKGFPDLVGTFMGRTAFVECKAAETIREVVLTRDQRRVMGVLPCAWLFLYENRVNCYRLFAARNVADEMRPDAWIPAATVQVAGIDLAGWLVLARLIWGSVPVSAK